MKTKLAINTLYLALYAGLNGLTWLLFQQIPFSVAAQFLVAPLVIIVGAVLLYLPYESALKRLESSANRVVDTSTTDPLPTIRSGKGARPVVAPVSGPASASLAAH